MCPQNQRCEAGACKSTQCSAGLTQCNLGNNRYACVNTATDPLNCGGCGQGCNQDEVCVGGACVEYAPAAPCTTCPCTPICTDYYGASQVCCAGLGLNVAEPICVDAAACP